LTDSNNQANADKTTLTIEQEIQKRREAVRPINERIARLREESVNAQVKISTERARLVTESYQSGVADNLSIPVQRAMAFKYLLEHCSLPVEEGQLIVGLRGTGPKEVPTYPEICAHSLEDLDILDTRENMPYHNTAEDKQLYESTILPFWQGKTIREKLFQRMPEEWLQCYEAGIWTEFMEQRAPGHTAGGERIFQKGILDIKEEIKRRMAQLDKSDSAYEEKLEELKAMDIAADALLIYAQRYAEKLEQLAQEETNVDRKAELLHMAAICRKVPAHAPETFWEALQHYWFIHVGITYETNPWDSFNPGRLDQHLRPFMRNKLVKER